MSNYNISSKEEEEFLKNYDPDKYKKASVTVDTAVFAKKGSELYILLVRRGGFPYKGCAALPGGFLNMGESLDKAAARELMEETGFAARAHQCYTLGAIDRDPRDRVITVLYVAVADMSDIKAGDDASDAFWARLHSIACETLLDGSAKYTFSIDANGEDITVSGIYNSDGHAAMDDCKELAFDHDEEILRAYVFAKERRLI